MRYALVAALALVLLPRPALAVDVYLSDLLNRPEYRRAYAAMLTNMPRVPAWITRYTRTFDGPSLPAVDLKADGSTFTVAEVCKTHDCDDYKLQVIFAPDGQGAWGRALDNGSWRWIGYPPAAVRRAVERMQP